MAETIVPELLAAMVEGYRGLFDGGILVSDGYTYSDHFPKSGWVEVGWTPDDNPAMTSTGEWADANWTTMERRGDITVSVYAWDGDFLNGARAARERVYDIAKAIYAFHRTDPTLGLHALGLKWTRPGDDETLEQVPTEDGPSCRLTFTINFYAYLTP
jgi:hypothetical protein